MMNTINLKKGNWLWWLYCRNYTLHGREIPLPKNLCRFWWIAVGGFISWIMREIKLRYLWAVLILTTLIMAALISLTPEGGGNILWDISIVPLLFIWTPAFLLSFIVPTIRVIEWIDENAPWILATVGAVVAIIVLGFSLLNSELRGALFRIFGIISVGTLALVVIAVIWNFVGPYLAFLVPDRFLDGPQGSLMTSVSYLKAKKRGICPLVNPPEGF